MFSDAHEALRQISKLRSELDVHRQLFNRLNIDETLEYNIHNLVHLLQQKNEECERKMFAVEFKQTTLTIDLNSTKEREREAKKQYNDLVPLLNTLTQQVSQLNKEKSKIQKQYIDSVNEVVSLKRERDAAVHGVKEKEHHLTIEQQKRQKLRSVYRVLNTSFNDVEPPDEIKEALNDFQKTLMN